MQHKFHNTTFFDRFSDGPQELDNGLIKQSIGQNIFLILNTRFSLKEAVVKNIFHGHFSQGGASFFLHNHGHPYFFGLPDFSSFQGKLHSIRLIENHTKWAIETFESRLRHVVVRAEPQKGGKCIDLTVSGQMFCCHDDVFSFHTHLPVSW